jgi:FKBP-type peptidyl-prolyl cis-trans isomerase SlyD
LFYPLVCFLFCAIKTVYLYQTQKIEIMLEISKHSMVKLTYDLRVEDENGEVVEQATVEKPLQFLYGAGIMLPEFESHLAGLKEGEPFTIRLSKNDAYGEVKKDAVVELPKHVFLVEGKFDDDLIAVGNVVPMMSSNGQRLNGLVLEVNDENVKMDFNHPLAGEDLYFAGKILEVREASEEEIAKIFSDARGCNCGSEGCDDDECGSDDSGCSGCSS